MNKPEIPHDAFVFVGDGHKALFLRNAGDEKLPDFRTERVFVDDNPPTREQGSDRPGRAFKRAGRSCVAALTIPIGTSSNSTVSPSGLQRRWNGSCASAR